MSGGLGLILFSYYLTVFLSPSDMLAGPFVKLLGCRKTCIVGLSTAAFGTILSALCSNYYIFLVTFGVVKGKLTQLRIG